MQTTNTRSQSIGEMMNVEYMASFYGIIKLVQLPFSLSCFIAASTTMGPYTAMVGAAGWIQFVSILAFVSSFIFYFIHSFRIDQGCPIHVPAIFTEFISSAVLTFFYVIAGIVAACFIYYHNFFFPNMAATTFFTWACVLLYGADAVGLFIGWRYSSEGPYFTTTDAGNPA